MSIKHRQTDAELEQEYRQELRERNKRLGIKETLEYIKDYADAFVLEGEDVTQSISHIAAIDYLRPLLQWLYHDQDVAVVPDFMFYRSGLEDSKVGPDLAIVEGLKIDTSSRKKSYAVGEDGPPPRVVFEVASASTWENDMTNKIDRYELLEVREYFSFDPNPEQVWEGEWLERGRLAGWSLNLTTGRYKELDKDPQDRLYSAELDRWLKVEPDPAATSETDRMILNLYERGGRLQQSETQVEHELRTDAEVRARFQEEQAKFQEEQAKIQEERAKFHQEQAKMQEEQAKIQEERAKFQEAHAKFQEEQAKAQEERAKAAEAALASERQRSQELEAALQQLRQPQTKEVE